MSSGKKIILLKFLLKMNGFVRLVIILLKLVMEGFVLIVDQKAW